MDCNNIYSTYHIFIIGASQIDSNIDTADRTESCYATLINTIMYTLVGVLLQSFKNETESTIHLEYNNQPGTPWRNQSAQTV